LVCILIASGGVVRILRFQPRPIGLVHQGFEFIADPVQGSDRISTLLCMVIFLGNVVRSGVCWQRIWENPQFGILNFPTLE